MLADHLGKQNNNSDKNKSDESIDLCVLGRIAVHGYYLNSNLLFLKPVTDRLHIWASKVPLPLITP